MTMQETVTNTNERKSLFSTYLEVLDAKESQALAERQLQEEKYLRRTQRIYDYHERQRRDAAELRRCLDYVSQHAHVLESVLRGAGTGTGGGTGGGTAVPLGAALVPQVAAVQRCMAQCVANAARIQQLLSSHHRHQMDNLLTKMEGELRAWTAFLHRAVEATRVSETVADNLHNMIAEQRRCVGEVVASRAMRALLADNKAEAEQGAGAEAEAAQEEDESPARGERLSAQACSTPIAHV